MSRWLQPTIIFYPIICVLSTNVFERWDNHLSDFSPMWDALHLEDFLEVINETAAYCTQHNRFGSMRKSTFHASKQPIGRTGNRSLPRTFELHRKRSESAGKVRQEKRAASENGEGQSSGFQKYGEALSFEPRCSVSAAMTERQTVAV